MAQTVASTAQGNPAHSDDLIFKLSVFCVWIYICQRWKLASVHIVARDMIDILFHCIRLIYNALHDISSTKTYFMPAVSLWSSKSVSGKDWPSIYSSKRSVENKSEDCRTGVVSQAMGVACETTYTGERSPQNFRF